MSEYKILDSPPTVEQFIFLRQMAGWGSISPQMGQKALDASILTATLYDANSLVGFARIVGDDALYYYIQDFVILPDFQGTGHGRRLMVYCLEKIAARADIGATIHLMAAYGKEGFYENFDFTRRPNIELGAGMTRSAH